LSDQRRNILGKRGEDLAAEYLQGIGYRIVDRNYRNHYGEIDIIARECTRSVLGITSEALVFVEVKTRKNNLFSTPAEAVTQRKQLQISKVALEYLARNNLTEAAARFDVVAIFLPDRGSSQIELIKNAFDLCGIF
jgi:putative endonuclease